MCWPASFDDLLRAVWRFWDRRRRIWLKLAGSHNVKLAGVIPLNDSTTWVAKHSDALDDAPNAMFSVFGPLVDLLANLEFHLFAFRWLCHLGPLRTRVARWFSCRGDAINRMTAE